MKINKQIVFLVVILIIFGIVFIGCQNNQNKITDKKIIKIGIITDLTGPAAYWGESTKAGAQLALQELKAEGYNIDIIYEDYQLDAKNALSAAQKLVNIDHVQAIYSEFNPASITVGSFTKDLNILHFYDAANISPLENAPNTFKTYLDYKIGCQKVAEKFKEQEIKQIGMLKLNLEAGDICLAGIKTIYPNVLVESYNLGDTNFNTPILKMKNQGVGALINVGFEGDTLNTLKALQENNFQVPYGTVDDTITQQVKEKYQEQLKGSWAFGLPVISKEFSEKLLLTNRGEKLNSEYGAAFAYLHIKQMAKALAKCQNDYTCVRQVMENSPKDELMGFKSFVNHIADIEMPINNY